MSEKKVISRRRVIPPIKENGRVLGSKGIVNERMIAFNTARVLGVDADTAAAAAGYKTDGAGTAHRLDHHPGLIERNKEWFAAAGVDENYLVDKIKDGMNAERTIAVIQTKEDGTVTGREAIKEADYLARNAMVKLAVGMMGMTPESSKIVIGMEQKGDTNIQVNITDGLDALAGPELRAEYKRRMAAMANGEPIVFRGENTSTDAPTKRAQQFPPSRQEIIDTARAVTYERAQHLTPAYPEGRIVIDPVTSEVREVVDLHDIEPEAMLRQTASAASTIEGVMKAEEASKPVVRRVMKKRRPNSFNSGVERWLRS